MKELVLFKLKSLSLMKQATREAEKIGNVLDNKYGDDGTNKFHFGIECGDPIDVSKSVLNVNFNNHHVFDAFEKYSPGLEISSDDLNVVLMLKSDDPDEALGELEEKIEEIQVMLEQIPSFSLIMQEIEFKFGTDGDYVKLGVNLKSPMIKDIVKKSIETVEQIFSNQFSINMVGQSYCSKTLKDFLTGTLTEINSEYKIELDTEIQGFAMKNHFGALLTKLNPDKYHYDFDQWMALTCGFLLKSAKINAKLNKIEISEVVEQSPLG